MPYEVPPVIQPSALNCTYFPSKEGQFLQFPEDKVQVKGAVGIQKLEELLVNSESTLRSRGAYNNLEIVATYSALKECSEIVSNALTYGLMIYIKEPLSNFAFEFYNAIPKPGKESKFHSFNLVNQTKAYSIHSMQQIKNILDINADALPNFAPDAQFVCMPPNFVMFLGYEVNQKGKVGFFLEKDSKKHPIALQPLLYLSNLVATTFPFAKVISPEETTTQILVDVVNNTRKLEL